MRHFKNCLLARMSDGHYCIIRDLGPVKGGKGLKHYEVVVDFTWRALVRFLPQITPDMIEAGLVPLFSFHQESSDERRVVADIYRLMLQARRRS
jgi:hypothetical protein